MSNQVNTENLPDELKEAVSRLAAFNMQIVHKGDENNVFNAIDPDALPEDLRPTVARLAELNVLLVLPFAQVFSKDAKYDRGRINEPQYLQRLREASGDKERRDLTTMQYAYRAKLLNTVLSYHQALGDMVPLAEETRQLLALATCRLADVSQPSRDFLTAGCVELTMKVRALAAEDNNCLRSLDGVVDLPWSKTFEAMAAIFEDTALPRPTFGARAYDFSFIEVAEPEGQEAVLKEATVALKKAWWERRDCIWRFIDANGKLNRKQYHSRLESASVKGDQELFERIEAEQRVKEAQFYLAALSVRQATLALDVAADKITPILRDVYRHTRERLQAADLQRFYDKRRLPSRAEDAELLDLFVALNNCVAAKKWLVESRDLVGIDNSYDRQVEEAIAEYDPSAYLDAVADEARG